MPLVSPKGAEGAWIDEVQTDGKTALVEALAHAATTLEHYVLSTRVNNAKNERNELIEPFENPA